METFITAKAKPLIFIFLFIVGSLGCSNRSSLPTDISEKISITYQTGPEIPASGYIEAWIENTSDQCISFPNDFNIKVFVEQNQDWTEIPNRVTYQGDRPQILEAKGNNQSDTLVNLRPDTSGLDISAPVNAYALIRGSLCDDEDFKVEKKIPFTIVR